MGQSQVDTGYYESMYERMKKALVVREGVVLDNWEKYKLKCE